MIGSIGSIIRSAGRASQRGPAGDEVKFKREEGTMKQAGKKKKKATVLDFEGIEITTEIPAAEFSEHDIKQIVHQIRQGTIRGPGGSAPRGVGKRSIMVMLAKGEHVAVEFTDGTAAVIKPARHGGG
jgi:hypothetical protein